MRCLLDICRVCNFVSLSIISVKKYIKVKSMKQYLNSDGLYSALLVLSSNLSYHINSPLYMLNESPYS